MILLLGGTSETAPLAEAVAQAGYRVLVSTATELDLFVGSHARIERRSGRLDDPAMADLIRQRGIQALIDATHPFAREAHATSARAASFGNIPYFRFERPTDSGSMAPAQRAADHQEAARIACGYGLPVLLTIGSRHVRPYAEAARAAGVPLFARILDHPDSHRACREAGIPPERVLTARGPFSVEENRCVLARHHIGVLVTKESGKAGGVPEKREAARLEGVRVIAVSRPDEPQPSAFHTTSDLVHALIQQLPPPRCHVLLLDLESVLVPEIWEAVAAETQLPDLALTTRDIADYEALMSRRIALCREHGLSLARLREIVTAMEPLPGATEFLAWAQQRTFVVVTTDTFYELAGPLLSKLGAPLVFCNSLELDRDGYMKKYALRHPSGKVAAVGQFQRLGWRVAAVGDSLNDEAMLKSADFPLLFRAGDIRLSERLALRSHTGFDELKAALFPVL